MWSEANEDQKFIKEISKSIIKEIAPEELDLFDELASDYFKNPTTHLFKEDKEDPLSFGINETVIAITTVTLAAAKATLDYLTEASMGTIKEAGALVIKGKIKKLFDLAKDNKSQNDIPPLSKEQMRMIHKIVVKQAKEFGVSPNKANQIAKAISGTLSMK